MFQFILIFLLSISTISATVDQEIFEPNKEDIQEAMNTLKLYIKGMAEQIKSMAKDKIAEFKKLFAQINDKDLNNNPLEKFFFEVWYPKHKHVLNKEEQKKYEAAIKEGVLIGVSEDEEKVFSVIKLSNENYIIPSNMIFGFAELMMQRIPKAFEDLKIVLEKEEDLTDEVLAKVFDKIAKDCGTETLLYDMLFMHVFQKNSHQWQKEILKKIK